MKQNNNRYNNRPNNYKGGGAPAPTNDISAVSEEEAVREEVVETAAPEVEAVSEPAPTPKEEHKKDIPQIARVIVDLCNIRKNPNPNADILTTAIKNSEFKVDKEKTGAGYVAIKTLDTVAYIREDLVDVFDNPIYAAHEVVTTL